MYHTFPAKCQADFGLCKASDDRNFARNSRIFHKLSAIRGPGVGGLDQCGYTSIARTERLFHLGEPNDRKPRPPRETYVFHAAFDQKLFDLANQVRRTRNPSPPP
jgi:hypothetical protein